MSVYLPLPGLMPKNPLEIERGLSLHPVLVWWLSSSHLAFAVLDLDLSPKGCEIISPEDDSSFSESERKASSAWCLRKSLNLSMDPNAASMSLFGSSQSLPEIGPFPLMFMPCILLQVSDPRQVLLESENRGWAALQIQRLQSRGYSCWRLMTRSGPRGRGDEGRHKTAIVANRGRTPATIGGRGRPSEP